MDFRLSKCCGATQWGETDICSECKEHATFETLGHMITLKPNEFLKPSDLNIPE